MAGSDNDGMDLAAGDTLELRAVAHVPNVTAQIRTCPQSGGMSTMRIVESIGSVQPGDVLVSHSTAVSEHEISVVPHAPHAVSPTHDVAVGDGRLQADAMGVDAWLTEDHTHVVKIASHRTPDQS